MHLVLYQPLFTAAVLPEPPPLAELQYIKGSSPVKILE